MGTPILKAILFTTFAVYFANCNMEKQQVYILLIGTSGSGKSTTMNRLLNTDLAPTGSSESTTSEINEYSVFVSGNNNTELIIIDTPGLGDTRGLERDAQFLSTLQEYMKNHKQLSKRPPDVVLICSRFDENRFHGESSKYVKMLKSIGVLRNQIVNMETSNLIFVMTHFMGIGDNLVGKPEAIASSWKQTINEFSLFPNPINIVFAENKADEWELEETPSGFKLPNGDVYPENLCKAIENLLQKDNSDKINLLKSVCNRKETNLTAESVSQIDLIPLNNPATKSFLATLTAANFIIADTQVSKILTQTFANLSDSVRNAFPAHALPYLQKALHLRLITETKDIPISNEDVASLFREIGNENYISVVLKKAFNLEQPSPPFDFSIGNSYSIMQDSVLTTNVFQDESENRVPSKLGYLMPAKVIVSKIGSNEVIVSGEIFSSTAGYLKYRAASLGVEMNLLENIVVEKTKPGTNLITNGKGCGSIYIEVRLYKLEIDNSINLSKRFANQLQNLPVFNTSDLYSIQAWNRFFIVYGTHVVVSSFVGGSLEILLHEREDEQCSNFSNLARLVQEDIEKTKGVNVSTLTLLHKGKIAKISGGDYVFHSDNLKSFFEMDSERASSFFTSWKDSLRKTPAILYSGFKIKPIADFIKRVSNDLSRKLNAPLNFFLTDKVETHPLLSLVHSLQNEAKTVTQDYATCKQKTEEYSKKSAQNNKYILNVTQQIITERQTVNEVKLKVTLLEGQIRLLASEVSGLKTDNRDLQTKLTEEQRKHHEVSMYLMQRNSEIAMYKSKETTKAETIACEGNKVILRCGTSTEKVRIISANYGRLEGGDAVCPNIFIRTTSCSAINSKNIVVNRCQGKQSCELEASNKVFGDPCVGTYKYLKVLFDCV